MYNKVYHKVYHLNHFIYLRFLFIILNTVFPSVKVISTFRLSIPLSCGVNISFHGFKLPVFLCNEVTYSSLLAWRIPWSQEPGGPTVHGLQRVRHD